MNMSERPLALVVAGYDPSGGAGVLSDIKTLESNSVYGYAVCTAFTWQNEREIRKVEWFTEADIFSQIDVCFASAFFDCAKIGITSSLSMAAGIIRKLKEYNPDIRIVFDPVVRASTGSVFWELQDSQTWAYVASSCFVLTPNWEEMGWLSPGVDPLEQCMEWMRLYDCRIYLKGGHHRTFPGRDYLCSGGIVEVLDVPDGSGPFYPKHGSGCVFSSALTAEVAKGKRLSTAALRAKEYTGQFLLSNKSLLGWHRSGGR